MSPEDEAVFRNILMAARFSYASFYEGQMRLGSLVPGWVSRKFAYQLFSNPGLRRLWNQRREFDMRQFSAYKKDDLPTRFEVEVANYVEELDRNGVQPSDIAMYQIW